MNNKKHTFLFFLRLIGFDSIDGCVILLLIGRFFEMCLIFSFVPLISNGEVFFLPGPHSTSHLDAHNLIKPM